MRSRADGRGLLERAARTVAVLAVAAAFVQAWRAHAASATPHVHWRTGGAMPARTRDSLAALARAGDVVTWDGPVAAVAVMAEPVRDPSARTRVAVVGDAPVALLDSLGAIDSLGAGGGALTTAGLAGMVRVVSAPGASSPPSPQGPRTATERTEALARPAVGAMPGRVLVLGRVGWEAKFAIAALEEAGWGVDARLRVADTLWVTQGTARAPTNGTHAAVVVLDSGATGPATGAAPIEAAQLARFVRAGGGLLLVGDGAADPAFTPLAPARTAAEVAGERDAFERDEPRHALPLRPLTALRPDAVLLERRDGAPTIAARRVVAGRVLQAGYGETWRWRLEAERDGPAGHRAFWNQLVATVAAAPAAAFAASPGAPPGAPPREPSAAPPAAQAPDGAPRAALVQQLGPATPDRIPLTPPPTPLPAWLGLLALALFVAEWGSRRARGLP